MNFAKPFFQLLRYALWQRGNVPTELTPPLFKVVKQFAEEQTVWGLVCGAIVRNNVQTGDDNAMDAMGMTLTCQRSARKMADVLQRVVHVLELEKDLPYAVFKGQAAAACYPQPELRALGDIDMFFPKASLQRAVTCLEQAFGIKVNCEDLDKHYDCEIDGVRIELHYKVETFGSRRHQRYFDRLVEAEVTADSHAYVDVEGCRVRTFSPMVHMLVVFKHLFNHFLVEGVGLRQFCDLAVMLHRHHAVMEPTLLEQHLKHMGYHRAFLAVGMLLVRKLGLPEAEFPLSLDRQRDEPWARRILDEVAQRGNFGHNDIHTGLSSRQKSLTTARNAMKHCIRYMPLARRDILCLIPKRIGVTIRKHLKGA